MKPTSGGAFQYSQTILEACSLIDSELFIIYTDKCWERYLEGYECSKHYLEYRKITFYCQLIYRKIGVPVFLFRHIISHLSYEFRALRLASFDMWVFPGQDPEDYLIHSSVSDRY